MTSQVEDETEPELDRQQREQGEDLPRGAAPDPER
jgi:hypothetical protein